MIDPKLQCQKCSSCNWIGNITESSKCPKCGNILNNGYFVFKEPQTLLTDDPVFVAFLDILGFKNMVKNNSIHSLFKVYNEFLLRMELSKEFTESTYILPDFKKTVINSLFISDSLILWTEDFSQTSLYKLIGLTSILFVESLRQGTPLRGAIDMGEIAVRTTFENKTLVGNGLTNAYENECDQDWAGCVVGKKCIDQFNSLSGTWGPLRKDYLQEVKLIIEYPIPMKANQTKTGYALNWLSLTNSQVVTKDIISESFSKFNKSTGSQVQSKIDNTLIFYDIIKDKTFKDLFNKK
jgi:hypothetical protein